MIQIIDITGNILHQQIKQQNELLATINACVSHELRNPLNSIKANTTEQKYLYKLIDEYLQNENFSKETLLKNLRTVMKKLNQNIKVQESSTDFMHFTI